jgi:hypothetical protein
MATPNLGIAVPVEAQANKSLTIADALAALDEATQGATPLVITGATTVTAAEFTGGVSLELTGTPGAPFNLTVPATRRLFRVLNSTDDIATVKATGTGSTVDVPVGIARLLYCDGAGDNIFEEGVTLAEQAFETKVNRITTDQTITGSPEQIQWNNEVLDEFEGHDNSTDNERILIDLNIVDSQAKIALLNVTASAVTTARIVRYNSSDVLQEVVAESESEGNEQINLTAINVRGATAGDYLVVDLDSTDGSIDVDRAGSFFLIRKASGGGTGGSINPFTEGASYCILAGKVENFDHNTGKIAVWTEVEDTDSYFGGGTVADEHVVLPFTGRYRITAKIAWSAVGITSYTWQIICRLNRGATTTFDDDFTDLRDDGKHETESSSLGRVHRISGLIDVTAGDEIDLRLFHFGANRDFLAASFMHVEFLGATPP